MKLKRNTLIDEEVQKYRERNKQRYVERNNTILLKIIKFY